MTTCKKMLSMLCMVAILSFSLVFVPTTKAQKMEQITISMEADANPAVAIGIGFLALICVVLAWYGISVVTDSTDAQSCAAFVEGKIQEFKESQNIKIASIAMFSVMHLNLIKQWVQEWIATQENAYVSSGAVGNDFGRFGAMIDNAFYMSNSCSFSSDVSFGSVTCHSINIELSNVDDTFCFVRTGYNINQSTLRIFSTSASPITFTINYTDRDGESKTFSKSTEFMAISNQSFYQFYFGSGENFAWTTNEQNLLGAYISSLCGLNLLNVSVGDLYPSIASNLGVDYPISAPANKRITIPAAQDVFNGTGSLESYGIDNPDYIDFGSALSRLQDMYGNPALTWEDVINGVNTGAISASDVLTATDAIPYVNTDVATGEIATSDTAAENVKPVALPNDLALPTTGEIINAKPYLPRYSGDETTNKFKLRLFDFFPFCLPWDIYQVLSSFDTDPVAPVIEFPLGKFFKNVPGVDDDTLEYVAKLDLGDKNFYKWFEILRTLECVGIIVGLVLVSRKLIHGGD